MFVANEIIVKTKEILISFIRTTEILVLCYKSLNLIVFNLRFENTYHKESTMS